MAKGKDSDPVTDARGSEHLTYVGVATTAVYLILMTIFCLWTMVELWPYPTPAGVPKPAPTDTAGSANKSDSATTDTSATNPTSRTDTSTSGTARTTSTATSSSASTTVTSGTASSTVVTSTPGANTTAGSTSGGRPPTTAGTTTGGQPATAGTTTTETAPKGHSALTDAQIERRQKVLCSDCDDQEACQTCVAREAELQPLSKNGNDPQCIHLYGCHVIIWQEERLLLLVLLAGALGALLSRILALVNRAGFREFAVSWLPYYYVAPFAGAALGCILYLVIRGGFFSSTTTTVDTNPFMFLALSALAGLFTREVMAKLKTIAESVFEKAPSPAAKPTIQSLSPARPTVGYAGPLTINGTGFVTGCMAKLDTTPLATTFKSEKQLEATLPGALALGKISVTVTNPGGTASDPATLEVTPLSSPPH